MLIYANWKMLTHIFSSIRNMICNTLFLSISLYPCCIQIQIHIFKYFHILFDAYVCCVIKRNNIHYLDPESYVQKMHYMHILYILEIISVSVKFWFCLWILLEISPWNISDKKIIRKPNILFPKLLKMFTFTLF